MQSIALRSCNPFQIRRLTRTCTCSRPSLRVHYVPKAQNETETVEVDSCETNVGEYCSIDGGEKVEKTQGEMEQEFLAALASYYNDGKAIMSDEEFEMMKEELLWRGSTVPVLDGNEQRFLEAAQAYSRGSPILSDTDFDALKKSLKSSNSAITAQGPRCSIRTRKMYSDASLDYLKMTLLNLPGALIVLTVMFVVDDVTGFELTKAIELPPPFGISLLWGFVLPAAYVLSNAITNILLKDALILKGSCPNCSTQVSSYFGEVSGTRAHGAMLLNCRVVHVCMLATHVCGLDNACHSQTTAWSCVHDYGPESVVENYAGLWLVTVYAILFGACKLAFAAAPSLCHLGQLSAHFQMIKSKHIW